MNEINKFERELIGKGTARAGNRLTLFISNEDLNVVINIINSLQDSEVLIDEVTKELVKGKT